MPAQLMMNVDAWSLDWVEHMHFVGFDAVRPYVKSGAKLAEVVEPGFAGQYVINTETVEGHAVAGECGMLARQKPH